MTLTLDRKQLELKDGTRLVLVSEHQRALPGEGGSDYKPVNVHEHLRRLTEEGKETAYRTPYTWQPGEMSAALVGAMAEVVQIPRNELPTKSWPWTLKQATYVLSHGMRYDRKKQLWYRNNFVWDADVDKCMAKIDRALARKAVKA